MILTGHDAFEVVVAKREHLDTYLTQCFHCLPKVIIASRNGMAPNGAMPFLEAMLTQFGIY